MRMRVRPRINRWTEARRNLVFSSSISKSLVQPHFVVSGKDIDEPISGMPGIQRQSIDVLLKTIAEDIKHGLSAHMLFTVVEPEHKDSVASAASDMDMHGIIAVRELKKHFGEQIVLFTDVCLCTATDHGHCGVIVDHQIDNDVTVQRLVEIAIAHAEAGSDYVSVSDMMDGRVTAIREALESKGHTSTGILSYAVKYASSFYGPFRDAASSSPIFGDRGSHQMDVRSGYSEAILEALNDEKEGADVIMVKPGLPYLDVLRQVADAVSRPVAVYNVSGEYSMVMNSNPDDHQRKAMIREVLHAFKRAGADIIVSYHAREAIREGLIE
ncbi:MAG: porphobilinogen synthase [Euryarchaeota archaeon]|nr:porphobilinogen synthase [Euryarchaeota archaeon]